MVQKDFEACNEIEFLDPTHSFEPEAVATFRTKSSYKDLFGQLNKDVLMGCSKIQREHVAAFSILILMGAAVVGSINLAQTDWSNKLLCSGDLDVKNLGCWLAKSWLKIVYVSSYIGRPSRFTPIAIIQICRMFWFVMISTLPLWLPGLVISEIYQKRAILKSLATAMSKRFLLICKLIVSNKRVDKNDEQIYSIKNLFCLSEDSRSFLQLVKWSAVLAWGPPLAFCLVPPALMVYGIYGIGLVSKQICKLVFKDVIHLARNKKGLAEQWDHFESNLQKRELVQSRA